MKTSTKLTLLVCTMMLSAWMLQGQDTTTVTPTPVAAPIDTTTPPPPPPAPVAAPADTMAPAAAAPAPEKEKKDGFNSHTRFGVRAGGIISKQDYDNSSIVEDPESKFGADLAIIASIPIGGGFFMIQPELHWMQKGFKITDADIYGDVTSTLNYFEIPLLARINIGGSLKIFALAGPAFGFLLSGTYEDDTRTLDPTEYLDDTELSGYVGIGAGIGTLELDVRYMAGLGDISTGEEFKNARNSSFGIGLSLKF